MIFAILGSLGGIVAFLGAIWVIVRAVIHQSSAVKDNTLALGRLTESINSLDAKVDDHSLRITRIEATMDVKR